MRPDYPGILKKMKKTNIIFATGLILICCSVLMAYKNTAVPEDNKKNENTGTDISDLVLIYHGSTHRPDWNTDQLKPYVYTENESGFHWLFDGFLFLEIFDNIRGYECT